MLGAAQTQREKGLVPEDRDLVCCERQSSGLGLWV